MIKHPMVSQKEVIEPFSSSPSVEDVQTKITKEVLELVRWILTCHSTNFLIFEQKLIPKVFALGRLFALLFLCMREEYFQATHPHGEVGYKVQRPRSRLFGTFFGKVRYWRTYFYCTTSSGGYYPLDLELGLPLDGFSMLVRSYVTLLATKMSYAQAVVVLTGFLQWSPCQKTLEEMVLGLGKHTREWFESASAPNDDGEVLVIQIDSKATPTATKAELKKRRGKRRKNHHKDSQRHRGRAARKRQGSKKRRKKGDKSKNGKMATIVVMYTLKHNADGSLTGPINKKVYASYAPKRHAVAIALREAEKRGFTKDSGKLVQIVTDGDNDLESYIKELFPKALHTVDVFHVTEYIWEAGKCLYKEGSDELEQWIEEQKAALYDGRAAEIVAEIDRQLALLPRRGPGMKNRRQRLKKVRNYISKRLNKINYKELRDQDLEISSGVVEGAVNYVIAKRFDCGGMRWIKERSEALLQLRCIEVNNDWDNFISFVSNKTRAKNLKEKKNCFINSEEADPLPNYGLKNDDS